MVSGDKMEEYRSGNGLARVRIVTDKESVLAIAVFHNSWCENWCCTITGITELWETVEDGVKIEQVQHNLIDIMHGASI